jgi:hypothetical protein
LRKEAARTREFVATHAPRLNRKGQELKTNVTDPDSAKMATGKGVIQGYAAQAAVDRAHQVIVAAEVTGSGSEQGMLLPMIEATAAVRAADTLITADAGYHCSGNVNALCEAGIPALVADNQMRQRDERFAEQAKHKAKGDVLHDKRTPASSPNPKVKGYFRTSDFVFHHDNTCTCPAGCTLRSSGALYTAGRYQRQEFKAKASDCRSCALRTQCIRKPDTAQRKVAVHHRIPDNPHDPIHRMRAAIDSPCGRRLYSQRIATVEPVFGNLRHNKRLNRFTLRGKDKVGTQWRLFCLVHNIEKVANSGKWG